MAHEPGEGPIKVPLEPVVSSNLEAIGYDPQRQILAVQFKSGTLYHYGSVSLELVTDLYAAESKGRFYTSHIKGKFPGQLMTGECPKCGDTGFDGDQCLDCGCGRYFVQPMYRHHAALDRDKGEQ
jgi:hypothetical protein